MGKTMGCPGCQIKLKLKPEYAGRKIKCPRCGHVTRIAVVPGMTVPATGALQKVAAGMAPPLPEEDATLAPGDDARVIARAPKKGRKSDMSPCPECGEMVDNAATKCPHCQTPLEADDEAEHHLWKPCPSCGKQAGKRVLWTFWGSFYFTKMFKHVRCEECGTTYNGKTGKSNVLAASLCISITLLLIGIVVGVILWTFKSRGRL